MSHQAFKRALAEAGTQARFAAAVGTSQQNVSNWIAGEKVLPAEFVLAAEREFGISRHDLRPDLYPRDEAAAA